MVGSGPFRFVADERVPGARVVYERFAGYVPRADGTPSLTAGPKIVHLDRVEWQVIPDAATAAAALQHRRGGLVGEPADPDLLPLLRRRPQPHRRDQRPTGLIGVLRFNHLHPPFDNPAIRRACCSRR